MSHLRFHPGLARAQLPGGQWSWEPVWAAVGEGCSPEHLSKGATKPHWAAPTLWGGSSERESRLDPTVAASSNTQGVVRMGLLFPGNVNVNFHSRQ